MQAVKITKGKDRSDVVSISLEQQVSWCSPPFSSDFVLTLLSFSPHPTESLGEPLFPTRYIRSRISTQLKAEITANNHTHISINRTGRDEDDVDKEIKRIRQDSNQET